VKKRLLQTMTRTKVSGDYQMDIPFPYLIHPEAATLMTFWWTACLFTTGKLPLDPEYQATGPGRKYTLPAGIRGMLTRS
jgi:hypothetical protein